MPFIFANPILPQEQDQLLLKRKKKREKVVATPNGYMLLLPNGQSKSLPSILTKLFAGVRSWDFMTKQKSL